MPRILVLVVLFCLWAFPFVLAEKWGIAVDVGSSGTRLFVVGFPEEATLQAELKAGREVSVSVQQVDKDWQDSKVDPSAEKWDSWLSALSSHLKHAVLAHVPKQASNVKVLVLATAGLREQLTDSKQTMFKREVNQMLKELRQSVPTFREKVSKTYVEIAHGDHEAMYMFYALNLALHRLDSQRLAAFVEIGGQSAQFGNVFTSSAIGSITPFTWGWKQKNKWFARSYPSWGRSGVLKKEGVASNCISLEGDSNGFKKCVQAIRKHFVDPPPTCAGNCSPLDGNPITLWDEDHPIYALGTPALVVRTLAKIFGKDFTEFQWYEPTLRDIKKAGEKVCAMSVAQLKVHLPADSSQGRSNLWARNKASEFCAAVATVWSVLGEGLRLRPAAVASPSKTPIRFDEPHLGGVPINWTLGAVFYRSFVEP